MKLDNSKVRWIVREKSKGIKTNAEIAESMNISVRGVQKLWARHRGKVSSEISHPKPMGRPEVGLPGRREHSAVLAFQSVPSCSGTRQDLIKENIGTHIPNMTIHKILREENLAQKQPKKSKKRKWVRYEREYSNSLWHTDYKMLDDGRWFLCYEDDASRFVTAYGVFTEATTHNALAVLDEAIKNHGKPACIMTDHGSQFYANQKESAKRGQSAFEERLAELGIRQILSGVRHPQTNGKIERLHGEIQRKLHLFEDVAEPSGTGAPIGCRPIESKPIDRFMRYYNYDRPHMSLNRDKLKTPAQA